MTLNCEPWAKREEDRVKREVSPMVYRRRELEIALGLKRTAIEALTAAGDLPPPIQLGPRSKAWRVADIEQWLAARPNANIAPPPPKGSKT